MSSRNKAQDFLRAMNPEPAEAVEVKPPVKVARSEKSAPAKPASRAGLKHIGAYFDRNSDTVEKLAVLKARLDLDNSELIKLAIDELHRKHTAKRAFGDA